MFNVLLLEPLASIPFLSSFFFLVRAPYTTSSSGSIMVVMMPLLVLPFFMVQYVRKEMPAVAKATANSMQETTTVVYASFCSLLSWRSSGVTSAEPRTAIGVGVEVGVGA
jgi:hypothetical protein